jgi:hypothetical protein
LREALEYQVLAARRARGDGPTGADLAESDARLFVAQQHGFRDWADAWAHGEEGIDRRFEAAADAVVTGDRVALETLLAEDPTLARARSSYGHHATLLHHVAANGVEAARQWSPPNAPEMAGVLLAAGAEPDAGSDSYAGTCLTTLCLLVSSCHPADAGVQDLSVKEPAHGSTALGMARYPHHRAEGRQGGSPDIAAILEDRMACRITPR